MFKLIKGINLELDETLAYLLKDILDSVDMSKIPNQGAYEYKISLEEIIDKFLNLDLK